MPRLSVWMLRAALVHMGTGFFFGAVLLFNKGFPLSGWPWKLLNPHAELMIFGWTMQLVMGVAFYALPRFADHTGRYGAVHLGWWSFYLLNGGVVITAIGQGLSRPGPALAGRMLILLAVLAYVIMMWPRVKSITLPPPPP